jgi:hypothetical protein
MASLKLIADEISDALNRPFDDMLKERIKSIFRHELAAMIRQQVNKNGLSPHFKSRYSTVCKPVTKSDSSFDVSLFDNSTFRTINKVAQPIRYNTDDPFTYVGKINGITPFTYLSLSGLPYYNLLPIIQKEAVEPNETPLQPITYDYRNGYIYIYFNPSLDENITEFHIMIEGVHSTYNFIADETKDSKNANIIYNDELEFPMPNDLIQLVKERLLKGELSIIDDKDKIKSEHLDNN